MTNENLTPPSVSDMLRMTGANTAEFMKQVADHLDKLEAHIVTLDERIADMEAAAHNGIN